MECASESCNDELDRLEGFHLRSFNENEEQTPSSGTTLLPTPNEVQFPLALEAGQGSAPRVAVWEPLGLGYQEEDVIPMPSAPQLKDLDSFTDGTGAGSFDFLSSHPGDLFPPLDEEYLAALYAHPADCTESINTWRQGVLQHRMLEDQIVDHLTYDPLPCSIAGPKRPRSITSSETGRKRLKPSTTRPTVLPLPDSTTVDGPETVVRERRNSAPPILRGLFLAAATPQPPHSKQL